MLKRTCVTAPMSAICVAKACSLSIGELLLRQQHRPEHALRDQRFVGRRPARGRLQRAAVRVVALEVRGVDFDRFDRPRLRPARRSPSRCPARAGGAFPSRRPCSRRGPGGSRLLRGPKCSSLATTSGRPPFSMASQVDELVRRRAADQSRADVAVHAQPRHAAVRDRCCSRTWLQARRRRPADSGGVAARARRRASSSTQSASVVRDRLRHEAGLDATPRAGSCR